MRTSALGLVPVLFLLFLTAGDRGRGETMTTGSQEDRDRIIRHIRGIFEAYLEQDRETIRRTHAPDWVGFLGPSTRIERGIEDYMQAAERSLQNFRGTGYELTDTEVQVVGEIGIVYYTARYDYEDRDGNHHSLPLRSVDIYRKQEGDWIQTGSHITPIPSGGTWGEGDGGVLPGTLSPGEKADLLAARESVWRAWFQNEQGRLREVLPEEFIGIDPGAGPWANRQDALRAAADFSSAGGTLASLEFPRTEILAYGPVAILFTSYRFEIEKDGDREVRAGRGTEVFVRRGGRWLNSAWHLDSGK